jgi:predicted ribosome quality control (RQC) complex YloA/Tae2 family protein
MTNQWNALILEGEEERIRHLLWTRRSTDRILSVGEIYTPPEGSRRRGIDRPLDSEKWREMVEPGGNQEARDALRREMAYTSSINLAALMDEGDDVAPPPGTPLSGYSLWSRLRTLSAPEPHLLETAWGLQPYPYLLKGLTGRAFPSVMEAMATLAREAGPGSRKGPDVSSRLQQALYRARGRIRGLEREVEEAVDPEAIRAQADLLLARLAQVPSGARQVTLMGFDEKEVEISLDPSLSPQDNAQALYREASKAERARAGLPSLLSQVQEEVEKLKGLEEKLATGEMEPREVEALLPGKPSRVPPPGVRETRLPYRRYRSNGGLEIRVGRGGTDNDALTFKHARPDDVWLHVREASGAHVVLRWEGQGKPPAADLAEAAILAALSSKARGAKTVPVDWTRRKYVRKPRKAPAGAVIPERVETLFVEPDPELPERLAWDRE